MKRLFLVEFAGHAIVAAEDEADAEDVAESAMRCDPEDVVTVVHVGTFDEGDSFPGRWAPLALPYGQEDDITIEGYFALARAAKAEALAAKPDPAAAVGDLFADVPLLRKGEG